MLFRDLIIGQTFRFTDGYSLFVKATASTIRLMGSRSEFSVEGDREIIFEEFENWI